MHAHAHRLTLVKGMNMEEVQQYAALVDLGRPDFIEIKGVTFCGGCPGLLDGGGWVDVSKSGE